MRKVSPIVSFCSSHGSPFTLIRPFTLESGLQTLSQAFPESSASPVTRRVIYDRLHYLLQHLLSLIPTLPSTLQPLLSRHFPHKRQNKQTQTIYIRNLLRISSYCPELSERILATIVDRAIQIDVSRPISIGRHLFSSIPGGNPS